jgi:hypothetical protein
MVRPFIPALLLLTLAACGGVVDPSKNQTETFNGTVPLAGSGPIHTFSSSKSGEVSAVVTSLNPAVSSGTLFGVIYGQVISSTCSPLSFNQFAVVGATVVSGAIVPGTYCIQVVDEGFFRADEAYALQVSHP